MTLSLHDLPRAFLLAAKQLADIRILGVIGVALLIAAVIIGPFLLIFAGFFGVLDWLLPDRVTLPFLGDFQFLGVFTDGLAGRSSRFFWTYLMAPLALAIVGALLDSIVEAVETRHYPHLAPVRRRTLSDVTGYSLRFLALMLMVSFGAWVLAWVTGVPAAFIFVFATGYLIAREYCELVALRRLPETDAKILFSRNLIPLWAAGCFVALCLHIPLVTILIPVIGVASFTHLVTRIQQNPQDASP